MKGFQQMQSQRRCPTGQKRRSRWRGQGNHLSRNHHNFTASNQNHIKITKVWDEGEKRINVELLLHLVTGKSRFHEKSTWWYRGGTKSWIWKTQVNSIVIPIYKNREKRIFEFGVRLDPPHWPSKFENHHVRVKFQNCRRPIEWPIKTCARRALSLWKRF